jgi:serine/threonine protein kinase
MDRRHFAKTVAMTKNCLVSWLLWISCCTTITPIASFQDVRIATNKIYGRPSPCLDRNTICFAGRQSENVALGNKVIVGEAIGSGTYGTVHKLTFDNEDPEKIFIGKRPWRQQELNEEEKPKDRAARCLYYWQVEDHCFSRLPPHPQLPPYFGVQDDWMVFGFVGNDETPAPTLSDLMKMDLDLPQELKHVGEALGSRSYAETLDKSLVSLLTVLQHVHQNQIVHRDIKPSNLLVHDGNFVLMDFGSAADLEPIGALKRRRGLENGSRVAVSPIYCAPEVFIELHVAPTSFDIFSSGLLFCQLLFSYLDERTDAGFHQQLKDTNWDLNVWLSNELGSKLRPGGLDHSLEYLAERTGLWTLLEEMLSKDPYKRPSAEQAIQRLQMILQGDGPDDYPFFSMVIQSMETCPMPIISRPLHYVATFSRKKSLGLVLSEWDAEEENPEWVEATKFAQAGEVFVKEIVPGGQADELGGVFEIGDQLVGIGELPLVGGGFEKAVEMVRSMIKDQSYSFVLQCSRISFSFDCTLT